MNMKGKKRYIPLENGDIRTLCSRCAQKYYDSGEFHILRVNPFQTDEESCQICRSIHGRDYMVGEKKGVLRK